MATAGADKLNTIRNGCRDVLGCHSEMTRLSSTTRTVAAAGPNNIAAANTNVSETEILAGIVGTRTVKEPLSSVSPAKTNH